MSFKGAVGDTFRSLRVRNFRLFFLGQFVSMTGTWMTMVAQTLLALDLGASGITLGLLAACQFGPVLLISPLAGTVADRSDKRKLLLLIQSGAMVQSAVLGLVVLTGNASLAVIFPLAAIQGVLTAFDNPTRRAFLYCAPGRNSGSRRDRSSPMRDWIAGETLNFEAAEHSLSKCPATDNSIFFRITRAGP